ncbi:MAG: DUF3810 domain-containing protein [Saccharofermentans sp.]|nr:DUF3810 domain-containing protein [Saccharofermentans sp.]
MQKLDKNNRYYISTLSIALNITCIVLLAVASVFFYIMPARVLSNEIIDKYARDIFPIVAFPFNTISNIFMQSLTELFAVVGGIFLFVFIIVFVIKAIVYLIKGGFRGFFKYTLKRVRIVLTLVLVGVIIFQLMIGINYNRTPVSVALNLDGQGYSCEDYINALNWAYSEMIMARMELGTDYNGVAHMDTNFEQAVRDANGIILGMDDYFDLGISPNFVRAKPVMLSYVWSYTGISGFYDALLGEANLNVDYMDILNFPVTLCHEILHAKGYSREYDANTAAVIACIESPRADFRYAGYFYVFMNLYGAASGYAEHEGIELPDYFNRPEFDMVRNDIKASNMYDETLEWNWLTDFINSFSEDVNDTYLKSNNQAGGTETYKVPSNIYVDFYYTYVPEA